MQEIYTISVKKNVNIYVKLMCKEISDWGTGSWSRKVTTNPSPSHPKKKAFDLSDQKLF